MRWAWIVLAGVLSAAFPVAAQIKTGEVTSSVNGSVSTGYTADYGNMINSDHGWTVGGVGNYTGSFFNPNFLGFNATVYLNQSRANSDYQSTSNASGVNLSSNIFSGSSFPGSITYSKSYNSEGNYDIPGLANYVTHGNDDAFSLNWNENFDGLPRVTAGFETGSSNYSVYGAEGDGSTKFHSFNVRSGYTLGGFNLGGYYSNGGSHALIPEVIVGSAADTTESSSNNFGFNASHRLPMHGSMSASVNRSNWDTTFLGSSSTGSIDTVTATGSVHPTQKLSVSGSANYSDNLAGQVVEAIVAAGGVATGVNTSSTSDSIDLQASVGYAAARNFLTSFTVEHRGQDYEGESYGLNSYGGGATYTRSIFGGSMNASLNITGDTESQGGEDTLGLSTTENYTGEILGWQVGGNFNYSQNVQTLLVTYMNSSFGYNGTIQRRWGRFSMGAGAGESRTALTEQAGTESSSQSYNASMGYNPILSVNGSYSKASGQALATGAGLIPVPVPSPILPSSDVSLYGGRSYAIGLSSAPVRGLTLTASYSKSRSNTSGDGDVSSNLTDEFNALIQYHVRKLDFTSGFSRLGQGFSESGSSAENISSFYFGVSRWFNFF